MTPVFFGNSECPLLGMFHEPATSTDRSHGVVICPPIGQEHVRSHWALRQVATALARAGFYVLRFDPSGVGDSAGVLREASLSRWVGDVELASQELRDVSGCQKLSLLGLRVGAVAAALASRRVRASSVTLWDPVLDGAAYVRELQALERTLLADHRRYHELPQPLEAAPGELVGFDLGPALIEELRALDRAPLRDLGSVRIGLLASDRYEEVRGFEAELRTAGAQVRTTVKLSVDARWGDASEVEELLLPGEAGRAVVELLEARQ